MDKNFEITITAQRTLDDFTEAWQREDSLCQLSPVMILGSPGFHWLALTMRSDSLRVEAIRTKPERRDDGQWERPRAFRIVRVQNGHRDEQELPAHLLFHVGQGGFDPCSDWLPALASSNYLILQYAVGRHIVTITPVE